MALLHAAGRVLASSFATSALGCFQSRPRLPAGETFRHPSATFLGRVAPKRIPWNPPGRRWPQGRPPEGGLGARLITGWLKLIKQGAQVPPGPKAALRRAALGPSWLMDGLS